MSESGDIDRALGELYRALDEELVAAGARCEACGRCCRFAEFDHELWLTGIEFAYLVAHHGLRARREPGVCPYLEKGRCVAREGRALSCRTFHCALSREVVESMTNRALEKIREMARERDCELEYAELFSMIDSGEKARET